MSTILFGQEDAAHLLGETLADEATNPKMRIGVITAFDPATYKCTLQLVGDTTALSGIPVLENVMPQVSDVVQCVSWRGALLVIGIIKIVPWASYTPTWASSGTQPSIGSGYLAGFFKQVGNLAWCKVHRSEERRVGKECRSR